MKNKLALIVFIGAIVNCFSQKEKSTKLGNILKEDLMMVSYEKDTTARAVVLYEHANYYIDEKHDYKKTTDYYFKVKILNKEGFDKATVRIPLYGKERVYNIKGITYNKTDKGTRKSTYLLESNIFKKDKSDTWREVTFTMPNVKEGSVIEYVYSITSPYSQIDDWNFQSDVPKQQSDFTASILGNWKYNIRLIGFLKLVRNEAKIKRDCMIVSGIGEGDCVDYSFGIDNIPAFKEEDYMLSADNFKSKIVFDLQSFSDPRGGVTRYAKTWKDADRRLKLHFLDNQVSKKGYFKKQLPHEVFKIPENLKRAKEVHKYVKNHYSWNGRYWPSKKVRVKKAFENKTGTVFDINLSLYNALKAANIESYLVLTSTRDRAMPNKVHPIINDFNYVFVKSIVNGKTYYLDATKKNLSFGLVRFQALNGDGRVLDFKKGSFWEKVTMNIKTARDISSKLELTSNGIIKGSLLINSRGYYGLNTRDKIKSKGEEQFLETFESDYPYIEIDDFKLVNLNDCEKPIQEEYTISIDDQEGQKTFSLNPFFVGRWANNPFKLKERDYPVDFGYSRKHTFKLKLTLPKGYVIKTPLKKVAIGLPNKGGRFILSYQQSQNVVTVFSQLVLSKSVYSSEEYFFLKEFFNKMIKSQDVLLHILPSNN